MEDLGLTAAFGLAIDTTLAIVGLALALNAMLKDALMLRGLAIIGVTVIVTALMNGIAYHWQINQLIAGCVICTVGANGGWAGLKQMIAKWKGSPQP